MADSLFSPVPPHARSTTPPTAPTTDFAVIEAQKENIKPAASGRSASTLVSVFEKDGEASKAVQEGHEQFRREIAEAEHRDKEGEDMLDGVLDILDIHSRYILFNIQHHPTSDNHLLPLLESTSLRFVDDLRYQQDVRYLKIWVQFARLAERREEVWAFLEARNIGTNHAQFYEEWATSLEGLNRKRKADEIYKLGIARRAAPLERLKARHQAFLDRVLAISGEIPDDEPSATSRTGRAALGQVTSSSTVLGVEGAQLAPSMRTAPKNNGARLEVFADGENGGQAGEMSEWAEFGTRDGRRKENVIEATPWKGEVMHQSAAKHRVTPRTPKVEVFKDVTDAGNSALRPAERLFSRSRLPSSEAELIKANPLRLFSSAPSTSSTTATTTSIPTIPAPPAARKAPKPQSAPVFVMTAWECPDGPETRDAKGRVKERRMFDHQQVYKGGKEWSFEEVRARQRGLLGKDWRGEIKGWEQAWHAPGLSSADTAASTPKKEEKKVRPPSPTVNTKLANQEIAAMFDQTIHGGKIRDSDSESSDDESDAEMEDQAPAAIHVAPTPLPASRPMSMPTPLHSMVPPTPTPAPSAPSSGRLNIFADENNVPAPQSAAKPARLNVFMETPARTPLAARTPLTATRPTPIGVFSDENDNENDRPVAETPSNNRRPLGNVFATPAFGDKGPARRNLASAIPEEREEGEEDEGNQDLQAVTEDQHVNINDEEDEDLVPSRRRKVDIMTPITERTCEFTTHTQFTSRSSLSSSVNQLGQSTRRVSVRPDTQDVEGKASGSSGDIVAVGMGKLTMVEEEEERSRLSRDASPTYPPTMSHADTTSPLAIEFDGSMSADSPFKVPEGFTIHATSRVFDQSMAIIDRPATVHFPRENLEENEETGPFVTASNGELADFVDLPNPCNPSEEKIIATLLSRIDPPLAALPGFSDHRLQSSSRLDGIHKHFKAKPRKSQNGRQSLAPEDAYRLELSGRQFEIKEKLGEGGFGAVFLAVDMAKRDEADARSDDSDDEAEDDYWVAIKVESPSSVWEAVILDRIHRRLDNSLLASVIQARDLFAFQDESYLILDYSSQGTLLDLVNKATQLSIAPATSGAPPALDEILAIFFTIELLRFVEQLHSAGFIHGDLKIDNCLVRLEELTPAEGGAAAWSNQYSRTGGNGWSKKGIRVIDFGRAIDTSLFPVGQKQEFVADWPVDERDCVEIKEGRSWSWQTDYAGLASVAYCLLFGKYIQTETVGDGASRTNKIATPLKRYWQTELWASLFDTLLNPRSVRPDQSLPITSELSVIRGKFEQWLEDSCQRNGKSLRGLLKKIETAAVMSRR